MDEALRAKLLANGPLATLVSKIAWDERPEAEAFVAGKGMIVLTLVTPGRDYTHEGWDGLNESRVQADIWARSPDVAAQIARAMPAAIEPETAIAGWLIGPAFLEADDTSREELGGASIFRRRQDWMIWNRPL